MTVRNSGYLAHLSRPAKYQAVFSHHDSTARQLLGHGHSYTCRISADCSPPMKAILRFMYPTPGSGNVKAKGGLSPEHTSQAKHGIEQGLAGVT